MNITNSVGMLAASPSATPIEFVRIDSDAPLTKSYGVSPEGHPVKIGEPNLCDGVVHRVRLDPEHPARHLGRLLEGFSPHQALATGQFVDPRDQAPLTTKSRLAAHQNAIARTKGWATYETGRPALICFDHDGKDLPDHLQAKIAMAGGFENYLIQLFPEIGRAARVCRASVSTGIQNRETKASTIGGGVHLYMFVKDGGDARTFAKRVHARMVLAGDGYAFVTKAGAILIRSAIDTAASCDPERLVFEGNAVLTDPRLEHDPVARAVTLHDGELLDTLAAVPPLADHERETLRQIEVRLRAAVEPEASMLRMKRKGKNQARRHSSTADRGMPTEETYRLADFGEPTVLFGSHEIRLDDGTIVTVADILRNPARFHDVTGADPLEWDYGGGRNKALILTKGPRPTIFSHAHGGQQFELRLTAAEFKAILETLEASHVGA